PWSRVWRTIKRTYNVLPAALQPAFVVAVMAPWNAQIFARYTVKGKPHLFFRDQLGGKRRGMTFWRDTVDWVGGYPFEVARADDVINRLAKKGFSLERCRFAWRGIGCNEYVFKRQSH